MGYLVAVTCDGVFRDSDSDEKQCFALSLLSLAQCK